MGKSKNGGEKGGTKINLDQNTVRRAAKAKQKGNARAAALHKNKQEQEWVPLALVSQQIEYRKQQIENQQQRYEQQAEKNKAFLEKVIADRKAKSEAAFATLKRNGFVEIKEDNTAWGEKEFLSILRTVKQLCKEDNKVTKQWYCWDEILPGVDEKNNKIMGFVRFYKKHNLPKS